MLQTELNLEQIKHCIKTLKKMRKFYKNEPSVLKMNNYSRCALGQYVVAKNIVTSLSCNPGKVMIKLFCFYTSDLVKSNVEDLQSKQREMEAEIANLFTSNIAGNELFYHSDKWRIEAKRVIDLLKEIKKSY